MTAQSHLSAIKNRLTGESIGMQVAVEQNKQAEAESVQAAKNEKARQWREVKEKTPETASVIAQLASAFGKPKSLRVCADGIDIINTISDPIMKMSFAEYAEAEAERDYPKMNLIDVRRKW